MGGADEAQFSCQHAFHSYCLQTWADTQGCLIANVRCPERCVVDRQVVAGIDVERQAASGIEVEAMAPESVIRLMALQS